ncbi:MAG TPA: PDZ domain-containing protein [Candidatus Acidoferrum sp.]|nr:PDZ domain-containing protein [Candidatus Acidoferrum sp.]
MNNRNVWTVVGLGALSVALLASPGASAKKQETGSTSQKHTQIYINQDKEAPRAESDDVVEIEGLPSDGDVQVLLGGGGSWLGVGVAEVTPEKVKELRLPAERGALLGKIVPDSPAARAGLKENDVITEINGQRVEGSEQFRRMIREIPAGRTAQLSVWRDGRQQIITVTLGKSEAAHHHTMVAPTPGTFAFQMPDLEELPALEGLRNFNFSVSGRARLGIDAENLEGDFGNYFGAPDGEGVLVRNVFENSPAAKAGLKAGDVITSMDGERIRSAGELREKLMMKKDAKSVKLGLLRNRSELSLTVELPVPEQKLPHHTSERTNI